MALPTDDNVMSIALDRISNTLAARTERTVKVWATRLCLRSLCILQLGSWPKAHYMCLVSCE